MGREAKRPRAPIRSRNAADRRDVQRATALALALVAYVLLIFGRSAGNSFVSLDDTEYLVENPHVTGGLSLANVAWAFTTFHAGNWHPLTWISHQLDCTLFGVAPGAHHLVSVGIHAANAGLLFFALRFMTGATWTCALAAFVFAGHPLRVESVAWASERKDVLAAFFFLWTLIAWTAYARRAGVGRYLAAVGLYAAGLLCKPMIVTLPLVLFALDLWPLERWSGRGGARPRRLVLEKVPLAALAVLSGVVTLFAQHQGEAIQPLSRIPFSARVENALMSAVGYLRQTFWPLDLAVFYPHPASGPRAASLFTAALISGAVLALICAAAGFAWRRRPYAAVGWAWYLVMLLPVIGLLQVGGQAMADRYTYLPQIGVLVVVAWGAREAALRVPALRVALATTAVCIVAVLGWLTYGQVGVWRNSVTLLTHAVRVTGGSALVHNNLGIAYRHQREIDQAREQFQQAVRLDPSHFEAQSNLGSLLFEAGDLEGARARYEDAAELRPGVAGAQYNLGVVLERLGDLTAAALRYERSIQLEPSFANAHYNLGVVRERQGDFAAARAEYSRVLALRPGDRNAEEALRAVGGTAPGP